jgi:hypothetical protein
VSELFFYCCPILHYGDPYIDQTKRHPNEEEYTINRNGYDDDNDYYNEDCVDEELWMPEDRLFRTHFSANTSERKQIIHGLYIGRGQYDRAEILPFPFGTKASSTRSTSPSTPCHYSRFSPLMTKGLNENGFTMNQLTIAERERLNPFVCVSLLMEMCMYTQDQDLTKSFIMACCSKLENGNTSVIVNEFALYKRAIFYPLSENIVGANEFLSVENMEGANAFDRAGISAYPLFSSEHLDSLPVQCDTISYLCDEKRKTLSDMVFTRYGETLAMPEQFIGRGWESMNHVSSSLLADMLIYFGKDENNRFI